VSEKPKTPLKKLVKSPPGNGGIVGEILRTAVDKGMDTDQLDKLVKLFEHMEDRRARQQFADDFAKFQSQCPPIAKTASTKSPTKAGGSFGYTYAPLDEIDRTVKPILANYGFSYSWDSQVCDDRLRVVCKLRHRNGHVEMAECELPLDASGVSNKAHQVGAVMSYAERYSLNAVLGLSMQDTDGIPPTMDSITLEQANRINDLMIQLEDAKIDPCKQAMLEWAGVSTIAEIPADKYNQAVATLMKKMPPP
jgi:hypothetical protein